MPDDALNSIDGERFSKALLVGIHRVIDDQDHLNKINVFPVADGDTGTNLSLSLSGALTDLQDDSEKHLGTLLASIADRLLDSARGNSGAIVAQFFQGLSDSAGELSRFTTYTFAKAVAVGSDYAHDAVSEPREGTILSIIKRFASSVQHQSVKEKTLDFSTLLRTSMMHIEEALAATPGQLDVLRRAGVVDAGAKGFADLIGGIADNICNGTVVSARDIDAAIVDEPTASYDASIETSRFRYCTECLVNGEHIDRRKLRESLGTLGDSLVLAGTKHKAKIHIHVDDPSQIFELAEQFGVVSHQKADDMHQQQSSRSTQQQFAVITDSAADLSDAELERLDIHIVPLRIQFGQRGYLDKLSLSVAEFYSELQSNPVHPTTSQPAPGDFRRQYQFLASHFSEVISITLSSQVSGTFDAAQSAAERIDATGKVHVVDSLNASVGQGRSVVLAAECAAAGHDASRALRIIRWLTAETKTFAMLGQLQFAVRGGRVPNWVRSAATLLRLTPILATKEEGQVSLGGFLFGQRRRMDKFARFVATRTTHLKGSVDIRIGHAVCKKEADLLASLLRERVPDVMTVTICELGTAIGVHGGPGTLVVSTSPAGSADDLAVHVE